MRIFPSSYREWLISIFRIFFALTAVILIALLFFQEKLIFHPEATDSEFKFHFDRPFEERWMSFEGHKISSLLFKAEDSKGLILYFHGNAGNLESWGDIAEDLSRQTHWDVWIIDYPGFGKSEGSISSEAQLNRLGEVFWSNTDREYASTKRVVFGRSIGTGLASALALTHRVDGLILESPYLSLPALANHIIPWLPSGLLRYKFRNDEVLGRLTCPIFIVHGTSDEVIPFTQGQTLASLNSRATFQSVESGHHNDLSQSPVYWRALLAWIGQF